MVIKTHQNLTAGTVLSHLNGKLHSDIRGLLGAKHKLDTFDIFFRVGLNSELHSGFFTHIINQNPSAEDKSVSC